MIYVIGINVGNKYRGYTQPWLAGIGRTLKQPHKPFVIEQSSRNLQGWWVKLELFDPSFLVGSGADEFYFFDIDITFLRNLDAVIDAAQASSADIVGIKDYLRPRLNSSFLRIKRDSPGARKVWEFAQACKFHCRGGDQDLIWDAAKEHIDFIPDELMPCYKVLANKWPTYPHKDITGITEASALVFNGKPDPPDVIADSKAPYRSLVAASWRV
jgi:hypothetical protein